MTHPTILRPHGQSLAVVVFADSDLAYLRPLQPGFRHCMVALNDGGDWMLVDPLSNGLALTKLGNLTPAELIAIFEANGLVAVPTQRAAPERRELPWAPFTCVETVKRALALRDRGVLTPYQLYRRITRAGVGRGGDRRRRGGSR